MTDERVYWERFKNKYVKLIKTSKNQDIYYSGVVIDVLDDKLIIDEIKLGEIPVSFSGLTVKQVGDPQ